MKINGMLLAVACLVATMAPSSLAGDIAASLTKLTECCPTMPVLVNESVVAACMPAKDKKAGFSMFGGSVEKNRSCVLECAFKSDKLTKTLANGSLVVDLTAVEERLLLKASSDKWHGAINVTKLNCTTKMPTLIKTSISGKCTSGAYELSTCIYKNLIMSCGEKVVTADCTKRMAAASKSFIAKILSIFQKKTTAANGTATTSAS